MFNGTTQLGTATTNGSGAWNFTTAALANGNYAFTATATDAAGNISATSEVIDPIIGPAIPACSTATLPRRLQNGSRWQQGNERHHVTGCSWHAVLRTGWAIAGTGDFNGDGKNRSFLPQFHHSRLGSCRAPTIGSQRNIYIGAVSWADRGHGRFQRRWKDGFLGPTAVQSRYGKCTATALPPQYSYTGSSWAVAGTGDFNGDGKSDSSGNGQQCDMGNERNDNPAGSGNTWAWAAGWTVAGTGDFNGDGKTDILCRTTQHWRMRLNGTSIRPQRHTRLLGAQAGQLRARAISTAMARATFCGAIHWRVRGMGDERHANVYVNGTVGTPGTLIPVRQPLT